MPVEAVTVELLVRYLDAWIPSALHARRATFVQSWPGAADPGAAEAVLRTFGEFADQMRGRQVSLVFTAPVLGELQARLDTVRAELTVPADFGVFAVAGTARTHLAAVLKAARSTGAPLFAFIDTGTAEDDGIEAVGRAIAAGKPAEILVLTAAGRHREYGDVLRDLGFDLVSALDLVAGEQERLMLFGTISAKSLEAFKNEVWQLDESAGVGIRDPHDPDRSVQDIALNPQPGPLRRQILDHLASTGPRSVTEVRRFALTETVYRVADVTHVLSSLVTSGALARDPEHGRLGGDTVVRIGRPSA